MAQDLLQAWTSHDSMRIEAELQRSLSLPGAASDAGEEERLHLLQAVAARLKACPDMFGDRTADPNLAMCAKLLGHLVRAD